MNIKTGYFAKWRYYESLGYTLVGITRNPPKGYKGINLVDLSPSSGLLYRYKSGQVSWDFLKSEYLDYLNKNRDLIINKLNSVFDSGLSNIVLCCYEKSEDNCHRHLLAKFLEENFGIEVEELT